MATDNFYVYVHSRFGSGEPFYVGKGHNSRAYSHASRNQHWKNIIRKDGGMYVNLIARDMDEEFALLVEVEVIDKLRRAGTNLANITAGGEGVSGLRHSPATRLKLSRILTGRKLSKEHIAKCAETLRGHSVSEATRAKLSAANKGMKMTDEQRLKLRISKRGSKLSESHKKAISKASLGIPCSSRSHPSAVSKPVVCVTTGEVFASAADAARHFGCHSPNISKCCYGKRKKVLGRIFAFSEGYAHGI
jgi:hypothetical protein